MGVGESEGYDEISFPLLVHPQLLVPTRGTELALVLPLGDRLFKAGRLFFIIGLGWSSRNRLYFGSAMMEDAYGLLFIEKIFK